MNRNDCFKIEHDFLKVITLTMFVFFLFPRSLFAQTRVSVLPELSEKQKLLEAKAAPEVRAKLESQRRWITENRRSFNVGVTSVSKLSLEQIAGKKGTRTETSIQRKLSSEGQISIRELSKDMCIATRRSYDAREKNYVTSVKDMNKPGNVCMPSWAYACAAAYESSYIRLNGISPKNIDCSEQYLKRCSFIECNIAGPYADVFEWMVNKQIHLEKESVMPEALSGNCPAVTPATNYVATDWGIVDPSGTTYKIAKVSDIKGAICKYGPIVSLVELTEMFLNYTGGLFYEKESNYENPNDMGYPGCVLIVGWDDDRAAWLIKNSWGKDWGEDGYMWINYHSNGIGKGACWILAKKATVTEIRQ